MDVNYAAKRIKKAYAWEVVGCYWTYTTNSNEVASKPNVNPDEISSIVNKNDTPTFPKRAEIYHNVCKFIVKKENLK